MANSNTNAFYSISVANSLGTGNRAPILIPHEYSSWADRIMYYLKGHDEDIWTYISTGKHVPDFLKELNTGIPEADVRAETLQRIADGIPTPTQARNKKLQKLEAKAMTELLTGIPHEIYAHLPTDDKKTPFSVWCALKRQFEGTEKINKTRRISALQELDDFKMIPNEKLSEAYARYNMIVNNMIRLNGGRTQEEINLKFMNSLTPMWGTIVLIMAQTSKNLDTVSLYDLFSELQYHEWKVKLQAQEGTSTNQQQPFTNPPQLNNQAQHQSIPSHFATQGFANQTFGIIPFQNPNLPQQYHPSSSMPNPQHQHHSQIPQIENGYYANQQAFISQTTPLDPPSNEEEEYEQCMALLSNFNPNFKKFVNRPSGNFRSQSYQHPHHYNQNSNNLQGGNHQQGYNPQNYRNNQPPVHYNKPLQIKAGDKDSTDVIKCHNCQGENHYARDCKLKVTKVKDEAYYLQKMEKLKKKPIDEKALVVREVPSVEVWDTDEEEDPLEKSEAYNNYYCFMAKDEEKPSPLNHLVVEKVRFMLKSNHLTVEQFDSEINEINELISEYVIDSEYRVKYYKTELNANQIKLDELTRCMSKLERQLEAKTAESQKYLDQFTIALTQRDIIAIDNREMFAQIETSIKSYKSSKTLLDENTNAILVGPKPHWVKYGIGWDDMTKSFAKPNSEPDLKYNPAAFNHETDYLEETILCSPDIPFIPQFNDQNTASNIPGGNVKPTRILMADGNYSELPGHETVFDPTLYSYDNSKDDSYHDSPDISCEKVFNWTELGTEPFPSLDSTIVTKDLGQKYSRKEQTGKSSIISSSPVVTISKPPSNLKGSKSSVSGSLASTSPPSSNSSPKTSKDKQTSFVQVLKPSSAITPSFSKIKISTISTPSISKPAVYRYSEGNSIPSTSSISSNSKSKSKTTSLIKTPIPNSRGKEKLDIPNSIPKELVNEVFLPESVVETKLPSMVQTSGKSQKKKNIKSKMNSSQGKTRNVSPTKTSFPKNIHSSIPSNSQSSIPSHNSFSSFHQNSTHQFRPFQSNPFMFQNSKSQNNAFPVNPTFNPFCGTNPFLGTNNAFGGNPMVNQFGGNSQFPLYNQFGMPVNFGPYPPGMLPQFSNQQAESFPTPPKSQKSNVKKKSKVKIDKIDTSIPSTSKPINADQPGPNQTWVPKSSQ